MLNQDFKEFVKLLDANNVEYMLVGGYAVAIHGYPRYTGDMDIWINPLAANAEKLITVFEQFGLASFQLGVSDFSLPGNVIQIGYPPVRIDVMTSIDGVEFGDAYKNRFVIELDGIQLNVIGLNELRKNKQASGRQKDIDDLQNLE